MLISKSMKWRNYGHMPLNWRKLFDNEEREIIERVPKRLASWGNRKWIPRA